MAPAPTVGVLALQGDFEEHIVALEDIGVPAAPVRTAEQLDRVGALIVPGGESTSMAKLMDAYDLREPLRAFARSGRPVWGTCAGMILLAERLVEGLPEPLGLMDMLVRRNGFGRQVDSFETNLDVAGLDGGPFHAVFIRAPAVVETGPAVEVLARLDDGTVVAARQGNLLATAFHPELTTDRRLHALFVAMLAAEVAR
ncbi:MAG: pyridoxal 5'-phosphate synthase glutaminase subunit PdxT [Chloroflexi bacterium]|nr:pyridoxal 5'-phosphate synthase glutaminase subunit PdxT [Chloroflexota bacterium]